MVQHLLIVLNPTLEHFIHGVQGAQSFVLIGYRARHNPPAFSDFPTTHIRVPGFDRLRRSPHLTQLFLNNSSAVYI